VSGETNVHQVQKALDEIAKKTDKAVKTATQAVEAEAVLQMKRMIAGARKYTTRTRVRDTTNLDTGTGGPVGSTYKVYDKATPNKPPKSRTTNLKRSIRGNTKGFEGRYTAIVGPYAEYGRSLELGSGRGSNVKFPFVEPTARMLSENGFARKIYIKALTSELNK